MAKRENTSGKFSMYLAANRHTTHQSDHGQLNSRSICHKQDKNPKIQDHGSAILWFGLHEWGVWRLWDACVGGSLWMNSVVSNSQV
jgi:hypothetical protein